MVIQQTKIIIINTSENNIIYITSTLRHLFWGGSAAIAVFDELKETKLQTNYNPGEKEENKETDKNIVYNYLVNESYESVMVLSRAPDCVQDYLDGKKDIFFQQKYVHSPKYFSPSYENGFGHYAIYSTLEDAVRQKGGSAGNPHTAILLSASVEEAKQKIKEGKFSSMVICGINCFQIANGIIGELPTTVWPTKSNKGSNESALVSLRSLRPSENNIPEENVAEPSPPSCLEQIARLF
ncbi:MAG: hypothetical protein ACK4PR_04780 [Gammaproteobacteria bacterium]